MIVLHQEPGGNAVAIEAGNVKTVEDYVVVRSSSPADQTPALVVTRVTVSEYPGEKTWDVQESVEDVVALVNARRNETLPVTNYNFNSLAAYEPTSQCDCKKEDVPDGVREEG